MSQWTLVEATAATAVAVGAIAIDSVLDSYGRVVPLVDPQMQTRVLPDGSRVSKFLKDNEFLRYLFEDSKTLYEALRRGHRVSNNGPMLGYRKPMPDGTAGPYVWTKYSDVIERSIDVAVAFRQLGIAPGQNSMIGLYSKNRPEWVIVEHATYAFSNIIVPLYETLGADACSVIIEETEMALIACDNLVRVRALLGQKSNCPLLKTIVVMEEAINLAQDELSALRDLAGQHDVRVLTFDELIKLGHDAPDRLTIELQPPKVEDLATLCYTSGTTGKPKGVMLTHGNIIADCSTLTYFKRAQLGADDVMISFLPLAHMLERVLQAAIFMVGARVGFFRGDVRLLAEDIKELRPTLLPVVPRVLNRVYDRVMQEVNKSRLKRALFHLAIAAKSSGLSRSVIRTNTIWDAIVFKKIRETMGGRVRLMITGSAPLSEQVLTFIRAALGCVVVEGYGQTECVAAATVTMEGDHIPGHVGMPVPCCAIKLVDVPELNYFVKDGAGEVCVRGTNVFRGYYKNPEQTAETLDTDGWLHTGDIGRWTATGTLKIVDRKKHIFKLSQGEYVAPEKIENVYARSKYIAQSFVYGESLKSSLVAIIVPDPDVLPAIAIDKFNLKNDVSMNELCANADVKKMIFNDMASIGKQANLCTFEQARDIYLASEMFTVENDLLTPTFKSKRPQLRERYYQQLTDMYAQLD